MEQAAIRAARDPEEVLARAGLAAKGFTYGFVGVLAIGIALGIGNHQPSQTGALHTLAGDTFGKFVLVLLAVGLVAYALWRLLQAVRGDGWFTRLVCLVRAAVYLGFAYTAARILAGAGAQSQNAKAHKAAAAVLGLPGGPELVGAVGVAFFGVGCWNLYQGLSRSFQDEWRGYSTAGTVAGVVGHVARFVVFSLIGAFALKAAVAYNPRDAVGLDGALQKLAHQTYGQFLLGVTAAGLIAYGIFCFVDARYHDVKR